MTSPHSDPAAHGHRFGKVIVTIDFDAGDCVIRAPQQGKISISTRKMRLHSIEEIQRAYQVQTGLAAVCPHSAHIAEALKFAGQQLKAHQKGNGNEF